MGGEPTLIQNVETLAHLALIARHGPDWFRSVGTAKEPGSTLISLSGSVARPGVFEVARGCSVASVLAAAGGASEPLGALLVGGYAGTWVTAEDGQSAALTDESLSSIGGVLAAGVIIAMPEHSCGLVETAAILEYLAAESAGQCGPCVYGLAAIAEGFRSLAQGTASRGVLERLDVWSWQVTGRGACHHPDGATRLLASALRTFASDVERHRAGRPCHGAAGSRTLAFSAPRSTRQQPPR